METQLTSRKPYQGVWNIVRFNWHFYVISIVVIIIAMATASELDGPVSTIVFAVGFVAFLINIASLLVSYYIYDRSPLYTLNWLPDFNREAITQVANIHAGFDETSNLVKTRFSNTELTVMDFYDAEQHTEVSIERARKVYAPYKGTLEVKTNNLPIRDNTFDLVFVILAAHEIRHDRERILFFMELKRIMKPNGRIIVTEHLRDVPNFLAYTFGFLHFLSKKTWRRTFKSAELRIHEEIKVTPFISTFLLE